MIGEILCFWELYVLTGIIWWYSFRRGTDYFTFKTRYCNLLVPFHSIYWFFFWCPDLGDTIPLTFSPYFTICDCRQNCLEILDMKMTTTLCITFYVYVSASNSQPLFCFYILFFCRIVTWKEVQKNLKDKKIKYVMKNGYCVEESVTEWRELSLSYNNP